MAEQKFYDMTDTAENIDRVIHDLVEVVTEENDGKVLMVEKVVDEETDEVSVNIVEADLPVLEGNRNEIVAFDGEDWGEQTGLYSYKTNKNIFEAYPSYTFKFWNRYWDEDELYELIITDITDDEEVVVYDMQNDDAFSSISTSISENTPLYLSTYGEFTLNTSPTNSISFESPYRGSSACNIAVRLSLFDETRKYRIYTSSSASCGCLGFMPVTGSTSFHKLAEAITIDSKQIITHETADSYVTITSICSEYDTPGGELSLIGNKNVPLYDTHFLSMSGKARLTVHDDAKCDITGSSQVYIHGGARFSLTGDLYVQGGSSIHTDGNAALHLHDNGLISADDEARMHLHDKSILTMGDCAQVYIQGNNNKGVDGKGARVILDGDSRFYMQSDSTGSPVMAINGGSKFYMNGAYQSGLYDPFMAINGEQFYINGNGSSPEGAWPTLAIGDRAKVYIDKDSWVKVSDSVEIHMLDSSFTQMTGNSHSEMHNDSFFIMKNRPENSVLEAKARNLYESANLARGSVTVRAGNTNTYRAEVKSNSDGIFRNYPITSTAQPSLYDSTSTRLAGISTSGQIFNFATTADTSYFAGTYSNVASTWQIRSNVSFTIVRQGTAGAPTINELHELPVGGTGIFWEDLTEEEKLPWYKKADNGHEKVEGSPFFQMVNNSSIDLDDGIDITGDSTGLYLNNEKIATEYSYETEEEGETILNTVNIETLFTELQSALVRIAELEETIQTLNP